MSETSIASGEPWLMRTPPLEAVTCLFFIILFLVVFIRHLYVTGILGRSRLAHLAQEAEARAEARGRLNARIRAFIDLVADSASARAAAAAQQRQQHCGLDAAALKALPATAFRSEDFKAGIECAVCLGEIAAGEAVRPLPECGHVFHVECIDMWFFSHSTCPLCRTSVLPEPIRIVESASLNPPANLVPPFAFDRPIGARSSSRKENTSSSSSSPSSSSSSSSSSSPSRIVESVEIEIPTQEKWLTAEEGWGGSGEGDIEEGCVPGRTSTAQRSP